MLSLFSLSFSSQNPCGGWTTGEWTECACFVHCCLPSSVQFSRSVVSVSLRPHESQHARLSPQYLAGSLVYSKCSIPFNEMNFITSLFYPLPLKQILGYSQLHRHIDSLSHSLTHKHTHTHTPHTINSDPKSQTKLLIFASLSVDLRWV